MTEPSQSDGESPLQKSSQASELAASELTGVIQQFFDGLADLQRAGLPSAELDSLQKKHPEAYRIYLDEQRDQPAHDRMVDLQRLGLATRQIEQARDAQNAERDVSMKSLALQERMVGIEELNAKAGRALSWLLGIALPVLALAALVINAVFLWHGKVDNFNLAIYVISVPIGAGGLVSIVRALMSRRPDGRASDGEQDEDRRR